MFFYFLRFSAGLFVFSVNNNNSSYYMYVGDVTAVRLKFMTKGDDFWLL